MILLLSLPIWIIMWDYLLHPNTQNKKNVTSFMFLCSIALILVLGLRSQYTGSADTSIYFNTFNSAKSSPDLVQFLNKLDISKKNILFSEAGFFTYLWAASQILPNAQTFLLITSAIIVGFTANFIARNSDDLGLSWIIFICLGSMTFAMNGMRQALAMSICLLSYEFVKKKKFVPFILLILIAVMFHKSSIIFIIVYLMKNMKLNLTSVALLTAVSAAFLTFAGNIASIYDNITGEDYAVGESFDDGGIVVILIYVGAILLSLLFSKRLKEPSFFLPLALTILGFIIYLGRFISTQIYERMSYYFFYFLIILIPSAFNDLKPEERHIVKFLFTILSVGFFVYRINKGAFANFALFF